MHERNDVLVAQSLETDRSAPPRRLEVVDQIGQRVADVGLGIACGADHQEPRGLGAAQHVGEQGNGGTVGPLGVVDDEHDRPRRRSHAQPRADGLEQAILLGLGGRRDTRAEPGQTRPNLWREAGEGFGIDAEGGSELIIVDVADVPPERLDHGLEGGGDMLVAASEQDERTGTVGACCHLRREPGLADTWLTEHPERVRLVDLGRKRDRALHLLVAPDEAHASAGREFGGEREARRAGVRRSLPAHRACGEGLGQTLELEHSDQVELVTAASARQHPHHLGAQDLTRVGCALEASGLDDRRTEDVSVLVHDVARGDADSE